MKTFFMLALIISVFLYLSNCTDPFINNSNITGYNLTSPNQIFILPDTLREISGITTIDSTSFACIQDENGILFIYDLVKNKIKKQYVFNIDGDYEGICRVGKLTYILRSDGNLYEISDYETENIKVRSYQTNIPSHNNEGLCYDKINNRLLIASKGKIGKGPEYKNKRVIYAFDLKEKQLNKEPAFEFDIQKIKTFASNKQIHLPTKNKKKGQSVEPWLRFTTSAITLHPLTDKLFLLSSSDHILFIFKPNGDNDHMELLDPVLFNKAEGITFLENGDMLVTNEGQDKNPTLLRFIIINDN